MIRIAGAVLALSTIASGWAADAKAEYLYVSLSGIVSSAIEEGPVYNLELTQTEGQTVYADFIYNLEGTNNGDSANIFVKLIGAGGFPTPMDDAGGFSFLDSPELDLSLNSISGSFSGPGGISFSHSFVDESSQLRADVGLYYSCGRADAFGTVNLIIDPTSFAEAYSTSLVPLPASLPMFGGALLGLGALALGKRLRGAP